MKFCGKCGNQNKDDAKFCTCCGALCPPPVSIPEPPAAAPQPPQEPAFQPVMPQRPAEEPAAAPEPDCAPTQVLTEPPHPTAPAAAKPARKGKWSLRTLLLAAASGLMLVLCAVTVVLMVLFTPQRQVLRTWDSGEHREALSLVRRNMELRKDEDFSAEMAHRMNELTASYHDGKTDYDQTVKSLDILSDMRINGLNVDEARNYVEDIETSRGYYAQAQEAFDQADYPVAWGLYEQVIPEDTNYDTAQEQIRQCADLYRSEIIALVDEKVAAGDYEGAIATLEDALSYHLSDDAQLTEKLAAVKSSRDESRANAALADAEALAKEEKYLEAMNLLLDYMETYGNDDAIDDVAAGYYSKYIEQVQTTARKLCEEGNFSGAITAVKQALEQLPTDTSLKELEAECITAVITKTDSELAAQNYDSALALLEEVLALLPNNEQLLAQKEKVEAALPLYLLDVSASYDSIGYTEHKNTTFPMSGKDYSHGFTLSDHGYTCYNVSAQYTALSMVVGHVDYPEGMDATVYVYLDSELAQTVPITAAGVPQTVELDITGVRQIKFSVDCGGQVTEEHIDYTACDYGFANIIVSQ